MAMRPETLSGRRTAAPPVERERMFDARRRRDQPWRKWYKLAIWVKVLRPAQLARQPLCEMCLKEGVTTPATIGSHRTPHEGEWALFVDEENHESLCKPHHDSEAQRRDRAASKYRRRA